MSGLGGQVPDPTPIDKVLGLLVAQNARFTDTCFPDVQYPKNCLICIHGEGTFGGKGTNIGRTPSLQDDVHEAVVAMIYEAGRKIYELEALTHAGASRTLGMCVCV